jgi:hypothetical protein
MREKVYFSKFYNRDQYYQLQTFAVIYGFNNPVGKILRFIGKFIGIYIPYAMKLCL